MSERSLLVHLASVSESDFDQLADLRVAAMKESLERVGRFDPERARARLRNSFSPEHTRFIVYENKVAGFCAVRSSTDGLHLDHLYIHPSFQNRGIGGAVLKIIFRDADRCKASILVGALKESASNRFYPRHGFTLISEGEWDIYYVRASEVASIE